MNTRNVWFFCAVVAFTLSLASSDEEKVIENYSGIPKEKSAPEEWNKIAQVLVVNLPFRPKKWNAMVTHLQKSSILKHFPITREFAVVGKEVDLVSYYEEGKISHDAYWSMLHPRTVGGEFMTPGALGCFLSHINVWKKCIQLNKPVIVFEDDIALTDDFDSRFTQVLKDLPDDFGFMYFADMVRTSSSLRSAQPYKDSTAINILKHGEHWGTYAYVISPHAANTLYNSVYPLTYQVDSFIIATCRKQGLLVFRATENLVHTDNSPVRVSDVQQIGPGDTKPSLIPKTFHLIKLPPLVFYTNNMIQRIAKAKEKSGLKVEHWDRQRILQLGKHIGSLDIMDPFYSVKLLRTHLSILYYQGGYAVDPTFKMHRSISKILLHVGGFITYSKSSDGMISYPVMGIPPADPQVASILVEINHILANVNGTISALQVNQKIFDVISQSTTKLTKPGNILLFPGGLLAQKG